MKHKHFKEMTEYAIDAQNSETPWELWECNYNGQGWQLLFGESIWALNTKYRRIDPYRELKEAQERGEEIEMLDNDGIWVTGDTFNWSFNNPPERYRIKPKTKKIYLWALEDSNGWFISQAYMQTEEELRKYYAHKGDCPVRRLDNTMIEVEDV